jgi:hypothetical protein
MYLFDRDIDLECSGESAFEGIVAPNWSIKGNPNGGYLMAFLASAMQKKSDKKWPVIVTANFLTKVQSNGGTYFCGKTVEPVSGQPDSGRH